MSSSVICALLLVCVSLIECQDFAPPCPKCKYTPGHAFMRHFRGFCRTYFECVWNEYYQNNSRYEMTCCNPQDREVFDDEKYPPGCYKQDRSIFCNPALYYGCPPPLPSACPLRASSRNKQAYQIQEFGVWIDVLCPGDLVYSQAICTCIFPPPDIETCGLLIDFDFNLNVLSQECGGWTVGEIIGDAFIVQGYLCFHEYGEFFGISKLQEWFESSLKKQFTLSFRFIFHGTINSTINSTSGLFSANCLWRSSGSPVELLIVDSELAVVLGKETHWNKTGVEIFPHEWYHIAVTYYYGNYTVYLNAEQVYDKYNDYDLARTFTHSTLGYVEEDLFFHGCVDDFLFYTDALNQTQLYEHYTNTTVRNFSIE